MKNKLHNDAKIFWKYGSIVLYYNNSMIKRIIRKLAQCKMNRITRFYDAVIPNQAIIKGIPTTPHGLIGIFISLVLIHA